MLQRRRFELVDNCDFGKVVAFTEKSKERTEQEHWQEAAKYLVNVSEKHKGVHVSEELKGHLETMNTLASDFVAGIHANHGEDEREMTHSAQQFFTCNTITGDSINSEDGLQAVGDGAKAAGSKHAQCREEEVGVSQTSTDDCAAYEAFAEPKPIELPPCAASMPVIFDTDFHLKTDLEAHAAFNAVPECMKQMEIWSRGHADAKAKRDKCHGGHDLYLKNIEECKAKHISFESRWCQYFQVSATTCGVLDSCHNKAQESHNSTCADIAKSVAAQKAQLMPGHIILCMIDKLHSGTYSADMSECSSPPDLDTKSMDIACPTPAAKLDCDRVATESPQSAWTWSWYRNKGWITKVVNSIGSQVSIVDEALDCVVHRTPPTTTTTAAPLVATYVYSEGLGLCKAKRADGSNSGYGGICGPCAFSGTGKDARREQCRAHWAAAGPGATRMEFHEDYCWLEGAGMDGGPDFCPDSCKANEGYNDLRTVTYELSGESNGWECWSRTA